MTKIGTTLENFIKSRDREHDIFMRREVLQKKKKTGNCRMRVYFFLRTRI